MYRPLLSHSLVLSLYVTTALAATTVLGPHGSVSIWAAPAYSTIRPCAAGCLWYNGGLWTCGFNSGYYDLAQELACSCSAKNICYCGKDNAPIASSYISSCISSACKNFPQEVTGAVGLYDSYCATANVEVMTTTVMTGSPTTVANSVTAMDITPQPTASISSATSNSANSAISQTSTSSAGNASPSPTSKTSTATITGEEEKQGLSQSDVIALAVGLGVGVPSLLLALATYLGMRRKKEGRKIAASEARFYPAWGI